MSQKVGEGKKMMESEEEFCVSSKSTSISFSWFLIQRCQRIPVDVILEVPIN